MWYCLKVFNTALNNILHYYWTNWANWDVLQVAPVQMADTRAENGSHIVAIRDGHHQRGGAEGFSYIMCVCVFAWLELSLVGLSPSHVHAYTAGPGFLSCIVVFVCINPLEDRIRR